MIKFLFIIFCLNIATLNADQNKITIQSNDANVNITTSKIVIFPPIVNEEGYDSFEKQMIDTYYMEGPRIILINSNGGDVSFGNKMIKLIKKEQQIGIKTICVGSNSVHSMAFNFMSNCDIRLMTPGTLALVHKIHRYAIQGRLTARNLRIAADDLDKDDEPFRQLNSSKMHLTLKEYDDYADKETYWTDQTLLNIKYLDGIAIIKK